MAIEAGGHNNCSSLGILKKFQKKLKATKKRKILHIPDCLKNMNKYCPEADSITSALIFLVL